MGLFDFFRKKSKLSQQKDSQNHKSSLCDDHKEENKHIEPILPWDDSADSLPLTIFSGESCTKEYEKNLKLGFSHAGHCLQEYFNNNGGNEALGVRWIKTDLVPTNFQHLCFALKGNIYSVIIEFVDDHHNLLLMRDKHNQLEECEKNDLIPCTIQLQLDDFTPTIGDNHLIHTKTRKPIIIRPRTGNIKMSPWEINNFGISIVLQQLKKEGLEIVDYCDVLGIEPQIWFIDKNGKQSYVVVETLSRNTIDKPRVQIKQEMLKKFIQFEGYFAEISIHSADAFSYDENGKLIDITKRFDHNNPIDVLYRDHPFYVNYTGLIDIERKAADGGVSSVSLYKIKK